jgi:dimeric dUTPase (all-alpha-NTP-PPase superfamily)
MEEKVKWTKEYLMCIQCESVELLEELPFKHWKDYSNFKVNLPEVKYEVIDLLHFWLDICLVWGITGKEVMQYYISKNIQNFQRQEDPKLGYVRKRG